MLRLFRYSSFVGLVAVLAVVVGLSWFYRRLAFDALVENETRSNVALTRTFANSLWPRYAEFIRNAASIPPAELPARAEIGALSRDLKFLTQGLHVVKVKIYDNRGLTVFSSETRQIGEDKSANPGFRTAAAGAPASDITFRARFDAWEGVINDRNLIASYIPVRVAEGAAVEAVAEVYSDVTSLVERMDRAQKKVIGSVVGAMALLYVLMLWIAGRSDRLLREQEALRIANEQRIRHQAYHDALTGLPNRTSFAEHLDEAVRRARRAGWELAVMFLDVDRFKRVNDSLGHEAGDVLLRAASARISRCVRESDLVFRMGGDEFTVLLENVKGPEEAAAVAARLIQAMSEPIALGGHEVTATVSIGIALYPRDDATGERLVKSADAAMYRAKELGRNRYAFFTPGMGERVERQFALEAALQRAAKDGEFVLHYQPRLCAASGRVVALEALLRWNHPERGLVSPADFIPLLEETGLIVPVGAWVLREACRQNRAWEEAGLPPMRVSVNLSPRQFRSDALVETVRSALDEAGLPPDRLEVELTETLLVENAENAIGTMERLKAIGVAISIDDFGTGYSSLNYLKRFPIDSLKLDGSFVHDLHTSAKDAAIVDAISALARSLGIGLVAEGVEMAQQADFLRARYCTELQGYLFSRPLPAAAVGEAVRRLGHRADRAAEAA